MASLAESSIASVPLRDLAALQAGLLKFGPENVTGGMQYPSGLTPSTLQQPARMPEAAVDFHKCDNVKLTDEDTKYSAVTPDSGDVAATYTAASTTRPPPHLTSTRSAPEADMEAMIQQTPSQKAFTDLTRGASFNGFDGGDTQPMDSQIYRSAAESAALARSNTNTTTPRKPITGLRRSPDGMVEAYDTTVIEKSPHTFVEGETGFIDLEGALQSENGSPGMRSTTSGIDELLASPQTQLQALEAARIPIMPETPSLAGHKRRSSGEIVSSTTVAAKKTPGFSQIFGVTSKAPVMSVSQLFAQTQAPSSPIPDAPRSDPLLTRPSPSMLERSAFSSPPILRSSPLMTMHSRPTSANTGEPKENYTSMQESDERRQVREEEEANAVYPDEDDFDMDDDFVRPRLPISRMQRVMSDQTLHELARRRAPVRPPSRPGSSRKEIATIDLVTPATVRQLPARAEFDFDEVSDDGDPMVEDEHGNGDLADDDDVYDELAQTVSRSQPDGMDLNDHEVDNEMIEQVDEVHDEGAGKGAEMGDSDHAVDADVPRHYHRTMEAPDEIGEAEKAVTATQRSAVADSQPLPGDKRRTQLETVAPSSTASFVPGSQYAGRTSEEQALLRYHGLRQTTSGEVALDKVPSSPPLVATNDTLPSDPLDASLARQSALAGFQQPQQNERADQETACEIPESDALLSEQARPGTAEANRETSNKRVPSAAESHSMAAPFSTAQTHLSANGASPRKPELKEQMSPHKIFASQHSRVSIDSPRKRAGVRAFAAIAADPSPPEASGEMEVDYEAMVSFVYTAEDHEFLETMSSPASEKVSKRRRLNNTSVRQVSSAATSPTKALDESEPADEQVQAISGLPAVDDPKPTVVQLSNVLQSNEIRANEFPTSTLENENAPKGTQDSTKKREQAGAAVVSQLLAARSTRTGQKLSGLGRRTTTSVELGVAPKKIGMAARRKSKEQKRTNARAASIPADAEMEDAEVAQPVVDDIPVSENVPAELRQGGKVKVAADVQADDDPGNAIIAPLRVFALFRGTPTNFYPATWLETAGDSNAQTIRFDDNTTISLDASHLSTLDLRVGDNVKVDGAGMRNKTWIVKGFGSIVQTSEERAIGSDIHGHTIVKVHAKPGGRNSTAGTDAPAAGHGEVIEVFVNRIYLTPTMWSAFSKREFLPPHDRGRNATRLDTPTTGLQTPDVETPGSRTRRSNIPSAKATAQKSHLRDDSVTSKCAHTGTPVFNNMAFAISYGSNEAEKRGITASIKRNGGMILDSGFEELFDIPSLPESDKQGDNEQTSLQLKKQYADLGFVALIADRHSRRAKYVQALALGLPTLSGRWITDSLQTSRSERHVALSWSKYLLAAGDSSYLGGAIRSRSLPAYEATDAKLANTIAQRGVLLAGDNVLIVASQKHKTWDRRKAYAFLTLALGAARVKRVNDVTSARSTLKAEKDQWQWVYVDGSVTDASKILFGSTVWNDVERKRKRDDAGTTTKSDAKVMVASSANGAIKAVNDEFVVQSLILGALVD